MAVVYAHTLRPMETPADLVNASTAQFKSTSVADYRPIQLTLLDTIHGLRNQYTDKASPQDHTANGVQAMTQVG